MSRTNSQWSRSHLWDIFSSAAITMIRMGYGEAKVPEDIDVYEYLVCEYMVSWRKPLTFLLTF